MRKNYTEIRDILYAKNIHGRCNHQNTVGDFGFLSHTNPKYLPKNPFDKILYTTLPPFFFTY